MYSPPISMEAVELRGNKRLKDGILQLKRYAITVVKHGKEALFFCGPGRNKYSLRVGITGVAKHFNYYIFKRPYILLCLTSLCLCCAKAHKPITKIILNTGVIFARNVLNELLE